MSERAVARRFSPARSGGRNFLPDGEVAAAVLDPASGPDRSPAGGRPAAGEAPEGLPVAGSGFGDRAIPRPCLAAAGAVPAGGVRGRS